MTPEEMEMMMQQQQLNGITSDASTKQMQQQFFLEEKEKGMIEEQLSLKDEIKRITLLLRGYQEEYDIENDRLKWVAPKDSEMIILTDYGINLILNSIGFYVNKNTLLSNYDENRILMKMRDFSSALNKTVYMESKKVFKEPTLEECKAVLRERIKKKVNLRMFANEIAGIKNVSEEEIRKGFVKEIENHIEKELRKIKETLNNSRQTRYLILMREVQDVVESTYRRAYMGMERRSIREHQMVTETRGGMQMPQKQGGIMGWLKG